jgi:hypothetical protein
MALFSQPEKVASHSLNTKYPRSRLFSRTFEEVEQPREYEVLMIKEK